MEQTSPIRRKISDERVGRAPFSSMDRFGKRFARLFEARLRAATGGDSLCRFEGADVAKFATLDAPGKLSSLAVVELLDGGFAGYLEVDPAIMTRIIESAVNAPTTDNPAPSRALTRVDEALARPLVQDFLDCFCAAAKGDWNAPVDSALDFRRYARADARFLELEPESDILEVSMAVTFRADAPEAILKARLMVAALERLRGAAPPVHEPPSSEPSDPRWSHAMRSAAAGSGVRLLTVLRRMRMSVGDASDLRPGDMLPLSLGQGMDVEIVLAGAEGGYVCAGQLGAANDRRAVMITDPPDDRLCATVGDALGARS